MASLVLLGVHRTFSKGWTTSVGLEGNEGGTSTTSVGLEGRGLSIYIHRD